MKAKRNPYAAEVKASVNAADRMRPFLAGLPPEVQGAALADLTMTWLLGHCPESRGEILGTHYEAVAVMTTQLAGTRSDPWAADGTLKQ